MNFARARQLLQSFDLTNLFIEELGWDRFYGTLAVQVDGQEWSLSPIAQKRGLGAYACPALTDGRMPDYVTRRKIDLQVRKSMHEHLIIYTDTHHTRQKWQWVRREPGRPMATREYDFSQGQSGDAILQRLQAVAFSFEEEENLTISEVTTRVRSAFDLDRVTKRFYERFKSEHASFMKFLQGIPDESLQRWYVSVTLNRLMFVYFVQKKQFLDNDPDYLRNQLARSRTVGQDRFYRGFLCPLFFEGFARKASERPAEVNRLLGNVPYLNGGIFQRHQIEEAYGQAIQIPDMAFEKLFEFFDGYRWHLDERPLRADNEVNPDVLGYIFEKYINQKQMGAYYTKEDITEYIDKNTILPYLFDQVRAAQPDAFDATAWPLLRAEPDRYIYPAVLHGMNLELPPEIETGVQVVAARSEWNKAAPPEFALPTEIWRETVARRQRCAELRTKLASGEIHEVNDLITYNLDIRQFAQDVIAAIETPDLLRAFFKALEAIKVLDPTVGSGAFLFAALNILEPFYEACLERMRVFLDELDSSSERRSPDTLADFRQLLTRMAQHPNERYFILKSIIVHNLYGVDIMDEAVEICKLRLFLKLVAQVDTAEHVEPLPDIDFNIRAGNTLVGFARQDDVEKALREMRIGKNKEGVQDRLFVMAEEADDLKRIRAKAEVVERLFGMFHQQQTELGGDVRAEDKAELQARLRELEDELNVHLARQYGLHNPRGDEFQKWRETHKPFHWFVEFYSIMKYGGFDVIVGNPPYLNLSGFSAYGLIDYQTTDTNNLYPLVLERCKRIVTLKGRQGYIVPISATSTEGYLSLQKVLSKRKKFISCYDDRPAHLFNDLDKNTLSVILLAELVDDAIGLSTRLCRWNGIERPTLFHLLQYQPLQKSKLLGCQPKIGTSIETNIWNKIWAQDKILSTFYARYRRFPVFYSRKINAFLQILDFTPEVRDGKGQIRPPSEFKQINFDTQLMADSVYCCLSSSLFRWFVDVTSDGSHLNKREIDNFPFDPSIQKEAEFITDLADRLSTSMKATAATRTMRYSHDTLTVECIIPKFSKLIIDEADRFLARHYNFTDEELDFIINYDIKYRMGASLEEKDDEE